MLKSSQAPLFISSTGLGPKKINIRLCIRLSNAQVADAWLSDGSLYNINADLASSIPPTLSPQHEFYSSSYTMGTQATIKGYQQMKTPAKKQKQ